MLGCQRCVFKYKIILVQLDVQTLQLPPMEECLFPQDQLKAQQVTPVTLETL